MAIGTKSVPLFRPSEFVLPAQNLDYRNAHELLELLRTKLHLINPDHYLVVQGRQLYPGAMLYRQIPRRPDGLSQTGDTWLVVTEVIGDYGIRASGFWSGGQYPPRIIIDYRIGVNTLNLEFQSRKGKTWPAIRVLAWGK